MNVNFHTLAQKHGWNGTGEIPAIIAGQAMKDFREIATLGGFGIVGESEGQIHPYYAGGLDVYGVLDPSNTAVSKEAKARIAELTGITVEDAAAHVPVSSADKMNKKEGK